MVESSSHCQTPVFSSHIEAFSMAKCMKKIAFVFLLVGLQPFSTQANEVNPVYVDRLDWRLEPMYRDDWIKIHRCAFDRDYDCAIARLELLWSTELTDQQRAEVGRSLARIYSRLSEQSKYRQSWNDVVLFAKKSIELDDQFLRKNWNRTNIILGYWMQESWEKCVDAAEHFGHPKATDEDVGVVTAMHIVRCLLKVGRVSEALDWTRYAQQAIIRGNRFTYLSSWGQDIRELQAALKEEDIEFDRLLASVWWDQPEYRPHVLIAIQCDFEADHECAIESLEKLDETDLSDSERSHLYRTLSRHYYDRAGPSTVHMASDNQISDIVKAIELHDDTRRKAGMTGRLMEELARKHDWEGCVDSGASMFEEELTATIESSHMHAMRLSSCYLRVGDIQNARKWVARARQWARHHTTFIHEGWISVLNELSASE